MPIANVNVNVKTKLACECAARTHVLLYLRGVKVPVFVCWVDASYSIRSCDGRVGYEIQVVDESSFCNDLVNLSEDNLVAWRSIRCESKLGSTMSAELIALCDGYL